MAEPVLSNTEETGDTCPEQTKSPGETCCLAVVLPPTQT